MVLTAIVFLILKFNGVHVCGKYVIYRTILSVFCYHYVYSICRHLAKSVGSRQTLFTYVLYVALYNAHIMRRMHYFSLNDTVALCRIVSKAEFLVLLPISVMMFLMIIV